MLRKLSHTICERIEARSARNFYFFSDTLDQRLLEKTIEAARITFALVMFLRYARTLDTLFLFPQQSLQLTLALVVAYGLLALGLFTPFVLVLLIILEGFTPLFIAVKINALLPIVLLFLGAGRSYSLDRLFFSQHRWRNVSQFSLELFPRIRHYIILPYALLSFIAFLGHVGDPLWRNGEALGVVLLNPVTALLPELVRRQLSEVPLVLWLASHTQLLWEALMLPALLHPLSFAAVGVYGMGFFFCSYFVLNLSSLGTLEAIYWLLIFHPELAQLLRRQRATS